MDQSVLLNKTEKEGFWKKEIRQLKKYKEAYILLLPAFLLTLIFSYLPFPGIVLAFQDFDIINGLFGSEWVGFDNFVTIFTKGDMLRAIWNTLLYGVVILFGAFPFPILLAVLLNELRNAKFKKVVQTISYLPHFLSWISVVGLFYAFFAIEGTFNSVMASLIGAGYEKKNILLDSSHFIGILFFSHVWKTVGWSSVLFLAAIAGIDQSLYDAARVDGCGRFKQAIHVTIPCIRSTIIIVFIMSLGLLVSSNFDQVYGFQNAYTQEKTEVINTLIYREGIQNGKYSLATAFGLSQGLVTLVLILSANAFSKKVMQTSIW